MKPLLKMAGKEALKGRQNVLASLLWQASRAGALSPLRGWDYILLFTGVLPLSVLFLGLWPLGRETSINNFYRPSQNFQKKGVRVTERRCTKGLHPV